MLWRWLLIWCASVQSCSCSRPHARYLHSKKDVEDDFQLLTKDLDEYAELLQNAKTASQSAEEAAHQFAKENPKDFAQFQQHVKSAAQEAAVALEKANAELKKEDEETPRQALREAEAE
ncbi:unnamed protein product [Durusdinium trenchii]|uniref:Uncharacterized protein n=2 Tax=Durusdinium trenchii TaxID=1381693 RepID=A0ABP0JUW9_9DINO